MSKDTIYRQATIDAMVTLLGRVPTNAIRAKETIEKLPSAQPERKRGKWIDQDEGAFYPTECSECHKEPLLDEYGDCVKSDFCPNCGADMRGDSDEA